MLQMDDEVSQVEDPAETIRCLRKALADEHVKAAADAAAAAAASAAERSNLLDEIRRLRCARYKWLLEHKCGVQYLRALKTY